MLIVIIEAIIMGITYKSGERELLFRMLSNFEAVKHREEAIIDEKQRCLQCMKSLNGATKDQTSPRVNTLSDDQDDIQKQLDNEARDRLQFATPKTIWVLHFPTHIMQMQHNNKRIPWDSFNSKQRKDKQLRGYKPKWQQDGNNLVPRDYKDQVFWSRTVSPFIGRSESAAEMSMKDVRWVTARVPLPFNRYQTKVHTMNVRIDGSGRSRPERKRYLGDLSVKLEDAPRTDLMKKL